MTETRDKMFQRAIQELCSLRAKQARERGEKEFHIGDLDNAIYRWFFDAGVDASVELMEEKLSRVPA